MIVRTVGTERLNGNAAKSAKLSAIKTTLDLRVLGVSN
jgi:hypothetical protein